MAIDLSALSVREAVTAIYIGYYDRAADPEGIMFWEGVINMTSLDLVAVTSDFAGQAETLAVYPYFANPTESGAAAVVTSFYVNLFNREPDAAGLAFWTNELQAAVNGVRSADDPNPDAPILSVGQIITSIIEGAQSLGDGGFPDEEIILNKIEVALDWTTSAEASDIDYATNVAAQNSAASIIDGVTDQQSTVDAAKAATDDFFAEDGNNGGQPGQEFNLGTGGQDPTTGNFTTFDDITGTTGADLFVAKNGTLISGDEIDGGAGRDAMTIFFEDNFNAISAITESVESVYITNQTNDLSSSADNNVGGYSGTTTEVDVEIDAGRQVSVDRWEDFDSRADLVIEDARDDDDVDGTFTGAITVAMVSTDPGNVDFAVYFDDPVNTSTNDDSIFIEVIDQNNSTAYNASAITGATTGNLTDAQLTQFSFLVDGERITVELDVDIVGTAHFGADATYTDLVNAINARLGATGNDLNGDPIPEIRFSDGTLAGDDLTATLSTTAFDENIGDDNPGEATNSDVFGLQIVIRSSTGRELEDAGVSSAGEGDIQVVSRDDPADTAQAISNQDIQVDELIRLNVELDDVGKGSMGGDAMFGAMSTGRQSGDDASSDSIGIQQFDITVDRSSQLQTINSTNNALEVVTIVNGENSGINNTTTAVDEMTGDLVVRGRANPALSAADTDGPMPGALPQHDSFGFSDVQVINGAAMLGALDLTAELTEEIAEKYLQSQDSADNGEADDEAFTYTLGANNDEFLLNMSSEALIDAGTGSREDFDMVTGGGAGNDVITTNVGSATKRIDDQGQDHYILSTDNAASWYENSVFVNASTFTVDGGSGNDVIWTHGWGDFVISDGSGTDVVYTDNSGVVQSSGVLTETDRPLTEHEQIDYVTGAVWSFNSEAASNGGGATNEDIVLRTGITSTTVGSGEVVVTVSYSGVGGDATDTETGVYTTTATIDTSQLKIVGTELRTTEQAYNQAIKAAINSDPVLSQLMEAIDGAGNSLYVYTKTDGAAAIENLDVAITQVTFEGTSAASATPRPDGYDIVTPTGVGFTNFATDSGAESDNIINMAADGDRDVVVLSTSDTAAAQPAVNQSLDSPADLNSASNEELNFADGNFGADVIVNFDEGDGSLATVVNEDVMDFLHIDYTPDALNFTNSTGTNFLVQADSISVIEEDTTNDEASEIATIYNGLAAGEEAIAIVYDEDDDNTGTVYLVTGAGTATDDATVTNVGSVSLIGTDWDALTFDNFA